MDIGTARSALAAATVAVAITSALAQAALMPEEVVIAAACLESRQVGREPERRMAAIELGLINDQALLDLRYHDGLYGVVV